MQRTRSYDVPSGDAVMADGRMAGSTILFDEENEILKYQDAITFYQKSLKKDGYIENYIAILLASTDEKEQEESQNLIIDRVQELRKLQLKKQINEWRPPYAPQLGDGEIDKLSKWIVEQEERVSALERDKTYQFVKLVAGNLSQDVESLLIFNRDKRHSQNPFFEVPGDNSLEDVSNARAKIIEAIAKKRGQLYLETALNRVLAVLTTTQISPKEPASGTSFFGSFKRSGDLFLKLATDLNLLFQDTKKPGNEKEDSWELVEDQQAPGVELQFTPYQRLVRAMEILRNREQFEKGPKPIFTALPKSTELEKGPPLEWFKLYKEDLAKEIEYAYENAPPSVEMLELEQELETLTLLFKKTDIAASRQRMFGGLDWTERPENMKNADMIPELFMGIEKATMLVQRNVASLRDVPDHSIFIEHSENGFSSLFAELTARQINIAHFFEGVRGSFDRNHARVRLTIERLLHAMRGFSFVDNKVVLGSNGRKQWEVDRLDYM